MLLNSKCFDKLVLHNECGLSVLESMPQYNISHLICQTRNTSHFLDFTKILQSPVVSSVSLFARNVPSELKKVASTVCKIAQVKTNSARGDYGLHFLLVYIFC